MSEERNNIDMDAAMDEQNGLPVPEPVKPKRRWWLQILLSVVILVCGIAIGSAVTLNVVWNRFVEGFQRPEEVSMRVVKHMERRLDLTPEQSDAIQEIFKEHHTAMQDIRMEYQPIIRAEMDSLEGKVEEVLTPEQAEKWKSRFREFETRYMGPRPPGSGPGFRGGRGSPGGRGPGGGRGSGGEGRRGGGFERGEKPDDSSS